jgi:hypothetical protein
MTPRKIFILPILVTIISVLFVYIPGAAQAGGPDPLDLGTANPFVILAGTDITNNVPNQLVTGNTGHVGTLTAPFTYVTGSDFVGAGPLGTPLGPPGTPLSDEHAVFVNIGTVGSDGTNAVSISGLGCTFGFPDGAVDLATAAPFLGTFPPGVYCIFGAPSIGAAGITLNGPGDYVFKSSGSLTSVSLSTVTLAGADACNVFWVPSDASLGANTQFAGTILSGAGAITLGADADLVNGRLISESAVTILGGDHTITVPTCETQPPPPTSGVIGGAIIPIDMTSLFVAGAMTNAFWMIPALGGISVAAIALFKVKRKSS